MFTLLTRVFGHQTPRARRKKTTRQLMLERLDERVLLSSSSGLSHPAALLGLADQAHITEEPSKRPVSIGYENATSKPGALFSAKVPALSSLQAPVYKVFTDPRFRGPDAIQNAMDAAAATHGGVVFLPTGRYLVNKPLLIKSSNIVIAGENEVAVQIAASPGFTIFKSSDPRQARIDCGFQDFSLQVDPQGDLNAPPSTGIDLTGFTSSFVLRLSVVIPTKDGVGLYAKGDSFDNEIEQFDFSGSRKPGTIGIHFDEESGKGPHDNRIIGPNIMMSDYGVKITRGYANTIYGATIQPVYQYHYEFGDNQPNSASAFNNQVFGGYHENPTPPLSLIRFNEGAVHNSIFLGEVTGCGPDLAGFVSKVPGPDRNTVWYHNKHLAPPGDPETPQLPPSISPSLRQESVQHVHVFNVQDPKYGAKGNGDADDTKAIQAAIDDAGQNARDGFHGGVVFLPAGSYRVHKSLVIKSPGVVIAGDGRDAVEILADSGFSEFAVFERSDKFMSEGGQFTGCGFEDFRICVAGSSKIVGIDLTGLNTTFINRVSVDMSTPDGVGIYAKGDVLGQGPYYNEIKEFDFNGGGQRGAIGIHVDEELGQKVTILRAHPDSKPAGGKFRLEFKGENTLEIAYNATASAIQTALEALPTIRPGNVSVARSTNGESWKVIFQNELDPNRVPLITVASNSVTDDRGVPLAVTVDVSAQGPNANNIIGGWIADADYGIRISHGAGNTSFGVTMESIGNVFYELGNGRKGSAVENQVFRGSYSNPEDMTALLVRFNEGAIGHTIYLGLVTGLGEPYVEDKSGEIVSPNTVWYVSPPEQGRFAPPAPRDCQRLVLSLLVLPQWKGTRNLLHFVPENDAASEAGSVLGGEEVTILDTSR